MIDTERVRTWAKEHFHVERERGDELDVRCRLHDDSHASCGINVAKAAWKCQTCNRGGKLTDLAGELGIPSPFGPNGHATTHPEIVYQYRDETGKVLFEAVRYYDAGGAKHFCQRKPDGTKNVKGIEQVPYRLPELLEAIKVGKAITVVEGEKDVGTIVSLGSAGTTNA